MLGLQAATMLRDTVFVTTQSATTSPWTLWLVGALVSLLLTIAVGLSAWNLGRSVDHGKSIQRLETFVGVETEGGLSEKIDVVAETMHKLVSKVTAVALTVAVLEERSDPHKHHNRGTGQ